MVFSSLSFLCVFLPVFLTVYYIVPFKCKNLVLLIASLVFYAWGEPIYISLLIFSSIVDYTNGRAIEKFWNKPNIKRVFMIISVIINLSLLGVFKYADFLVENINRFSGLSLTQPNLPLPIGISFFTFQTMSYSIDVYRGRIKAEHNFLDFMTYVSMFPQLIAGPIVRFSTVGAELHKREHSFENFSVGTDRFLIGLFKKTLIADNLGLLWSVIKASPYSSLSVLNAWLGLITFTLQLYFDFSGYGDMAIGMGRMLGFHYDENFNYPLISRSVAEFWRRWHMSLSAWFKDYVYIPLGGNRVSVPRHIINLLIVWGLTGFWHGASWNFVIWGLYYGVLLALERYVWGRGLEKLPKVFRHIYTLLLALLGFCIFEVTELSSMGEYFKALFGFWHNPVADSAFMYNIINYKVILITACVFSAPVYNIFKAKTAEIKNAGLKTTVGVLEGAVKLVLLAACLASMVAGSYSPFLYFRF